MRCHAVAHGMQHHSPSLRLTSQIAAWSVRTPPTTEPWLCRALVGLRRVQTAFSPSPPRDPGGFTVCCCGWRRGHSADEGGLVVVEAPARRGRGTFWIVFAGVVMVL